jgi:hypothetical protein
MTGIETMISNLESAGFFAYVLPWLLTLALVYGVLEKYKIPDNKSGRAVVAIAVAFMMLPMAGVIAPFLEGLVLGLVIIISGILVALIFAEMVGAKDVFSDKYHKEMGVILIIIAILVFIGAGGLKLLGWRFEIRESTVTMLFFLAVIAMGIWWITAEKGGG